MSSCVVELRYFVRGVGRDVLDWHVDAMMDALLIEPNLTDPDVGVNFATGAVDVSAGVVAEDEPASLRIALVAMRSAARHIGSATQGWEDALSEISSRVRPAAMVDR